MKAPPFDYVKPRSIEVALALLAEHGDEARLLAGGQTLLATLNMRLSEPALLIDITGIDALSGIGVVRGMLRIGALVTHSEICLYDDTGQLLNGNMADYLVPMAAEMPDIDVAHIETPTASSKLGAKGAGEAGTAGAPAAVMNAINDALAPFKVVVHSQPIMPEKILKALGRV